MVRNSRGSGRVKGPIKRSRKLTLAGESTKRSPKNTINQGTHSNKKYRFATAKENYEDYSSGRVFYGSPGVPGFPVRLASEVFQRCVARLRAKGAEPPYVVYDPCCGGAYSAAVIAYLHRNQISKIYASDISNDAIELARRNLSLLHPDGLTHRIMELRLLFEKFNKQSHLDALESSLRLKSQLESLESAIEIKSFQFDILGDGDLSRKVEKVDLVLTDLPYGKVTSWSGLADDGNPITNLLKSIRPVLTPASVLGLTTMQKPAMPFAGYRRLEDLKIGKRRTLILESAAIAADLPK